MTDGRVTVTRGPDPGQSNLAALVAPLLALFVSEVLVVLFVTVFVVEIIFGIPGMGLVGYEAFNNCDFGLVMAVILLPVFVGLVSNLLKDVLAVLIDPRVSRS